MNPLILAVDVDGTLVKIEKDYIARSLLPNAKEVVNWAHSKGCHIILWTCRHDEMLKNAVDFLNANGVKFDAVNENYPQLGFETSRKIFYDIIIDDQSLYVIDWLEIKKVITKKMIQRLAEEIEELSKEKK